MKLSRWKKVLVDGCKLSRYDEIVKVKFSTSYTEFMLPNGQAVCGVAASSGVACFLKAGKNDNLVINRAII